MVSFGFAGFRGGQVNRPPTVKTAATLARKLCYENKDALMAGVIVGGYDPVEGG